VSYHDDVIDFQNLNSAKKVLDQQSQTQIAPRTKLGPIKQPEGRIMTLTPQWRYPNLTRNSFCILFPAKVVMNCRQIISSRPYVHLKATCSLAGRALGE